MSQHATDARIEPATARDVPVVRRLIAGLAEYEKLSEELTATEDDLRESLFGPRPAAEVLLARVGDEAVGFAVFFHSYSTFLGRAGLYLEDLFVVPEHRRQGYGRHLLAAVAAIAVERGCGRLEWSVLDWNEPARRFYRSLGALPMEAWTVHRVTGDALRTLAEGGRSGATPPGQRG